MCSLGVLRLAFTTESNILTRPLEKFLEIVCYRFFANVVCPGKHQLLLLFMSFELATPQTGKQIEHSPFAYSVFFVENRT